MVANLVRTRSRDGGSTKPDGRGRSIDDRGRVDLEAINMATYLPTAAIYTQLAWCISYRAAGRPPADQRRYESSIHRAQPAFLFLNYNLFIHLYLHF
jgi:hypothetical protein